MDAFISHTVCKFCFVNECLYLRLDTRILGTEVSFIPNYNQTERLEKGNSGIKKEKEQTIIAGKNTLRFHIHITATKY